MKPRRANKDMNELPKHADTKFQRWYSKQTAQGKRDFATRIGRHRGTVRSMWIIPIEFPLPSHYTEMKPTRGRPQPMLMLVMSEATNGCCSYKDMIRHFMPDIGRENLVPYTAGREFLKPHTTNRC